MKSKLTFIHAISPLHAGTGQGVGVIDLPIAREKATNIPYLPGSSVKGSLRDKFNDEEGLRDSIFGPEKLDSNNGYAGAIQFTDQTLLCLPVRSLAGTFAYVTSPYILRRLKRDANVTFAEPRVEDNAEAYGCVITGETLKLSGKVCLEDLDLLPGAENDTNWARWIAERTFVNVDWQKEFVKRFCVVSDNLFSFLLNTATEVIARNVLTENKTSKNLWYEEALPTESILFGLALSFPNPRTGMDYDEIFAAIEGKLIREGAPVPLQFGGGATVGRGLCEVRLCEIAVSSNSAGTGGQP